MAFLKYGTTDSAVVFRHDLKSALTSTDISGKWSNLILGSNGQPDIDPLLGTIAKNDTGNTGYRFSNYIGPSLQNGFQLSIEVQAAWLTADGALEVPPNGSTGAILSVSQVLLSALSTYSGSTPAQTFLRKTTTGSASTIFDLAGVDDDFLNFAGNGSSQGAAKINSWGRGEWITFNFGVIGNLASGAIVISGFDGFPLSYVARTTAAYANPLNEFYIGSDRLSDEHVNAHYFRNLQIVATPPDLGSSNGATIGFLSDSLTDDVFYNHGNSYDNNVKYAVQRYTYANTRRYVPSMVVSENGGYGIGSYLNANVLSSKIVALLTNSPTHIVISAGTNDAGSDGYNGELFTAGYKSLLETIAGVNGNPPTTVDVIGLCTPPPRFSCVANSTHEANHFDVRVRIHELPTWFKSAYPDSSVEIRVIDTFTAMGGNHAKAEHAAYPQNTLDDLHLSSEWMRIYGYEVAEALFFPKRQPSTLETIDSYISAPVSRVIASKQIVSRQIVSR